MNKRTVGSKTEARASEYLITKGLRILVKNYRCRLGEIDLIAAEPDGTVVFAEVKYRRTNASGYPEEAVDFRKQESIRRAALWYLSEQHMSPDSAMRFDVIAIDSTEIRWHRNTF